MDTNNRKSGDKTNAASATPDQGRSAFSTGTTTQGGSNFGQGSSQLGGDAYKQGSVANAGSNYDNEPGKLTDQPSGGTQQGGGAGGYDVNREQEQINKEREDMNSERDLDDVDVERPQITPDEQEGPGKEPGNPGVR